MPKSSTNDHSQQPADARLRRTETDARRLDDAARAGWLYYVASNTQEEIAAKLGVSRQSAQRLVSMAVGAGLIKVRVDHPIARQELGDSTGPRQDDRAMDRLGVEELQDRVKASPWPAVARGVVDEEDPRLRHGLAY